MHAFRSSPNNSALKGLGAAIRRLVVVGLAACLAACAVGPAAVSTGERFAAETEQDRDYQLGIGDKVRVIVYNEESLSGEFQVGSNGNLALPLVGDVKAIGQTTDQVTKAYAQLLGDGYVRDPKVSIEVLTYRPFFILGEVKMPGQYPYVNNLTVMNAIASAQGFTPRAEQKFVYIRKSGSSEEKAFRLTPSLRIMPGDTIRLAERFF